MIMSAKRSHEIPHKCCLQLYFAILISKKLGQIFISTLVALNIIVPYLDYCFLTGYSMSLD